MRRWKVGDNALDAQLYLFIASQNSITPLHIDRHSTFLMQFRGSKEVTVFDPWDDRVVSAANREAYVAYKNTRLSWGADIDVLGRKFAFKPGEALHIPFVSGHHVRNGSDDISISMSIIFNTRQSMAWRRALMFNHRYRSVLRRIGMQPSAVGRSVWRDASKAHLWLSAGRARKLFRRDATAAAA